MRTTASIPILLLLVYTVAVAGELPRHVPLPDDLVLKPPSAIIPPELAALSGAWTGSWPGAADVVVVFEDFYPPWGVRIVYAWGPTRSQQGQWERRTVEVADGAFHLQWPSSAVVTLTPMPNGTIKAFWQKEWRTNETILRKVAIP